jgi:hypothetical protein
MSYDGKISPRDFELSSEDEASELKSLSVWAERLTSPEQARAFFPQEKQSSYTHTTLLNVQAVRLTRPDPDSPDVPYLNVVWDPRFDENGNIDQSPGAQGHSGITGLSKPAGLANAKNHYKSLRSQLADLAGKRVMELARHNEASPPA